MAEQIIKGKVLFNSAPYQELDEQNAVLKKGEVVVASITSESGNIVMLKVGDGVSGFKALPWVSALSADVFEWAKAENKPTYTAEEINFSDGENFQQKYDSGKLKGDPGYTPIKGTDYWTEQDIQEMVTMVANSFSTIQGKYY